MKKVISLLVTALMLWSCTAVFAVEEPGALGEITVENGVITINGENISKLDTVISLQVLADGATWSDLDSFDHATGDITTILSHFDSVGGISYGGAYSFSFPGNTVPSFRVRFGSGDIVYYDPVFMENFNNATTAEALKTIIMAESSIWNEISSLVGALGEDEMVFWETLLELKERAVDNGTPFTTPTDIINSASSVLELSNLKNADTAEKMKAYIDSLYAAGTITGNSYDLYKKTGEFAENGMSESQKAQLESVLMARRNAYTETADFVADFNELAVLYAVNGGGRYFVLHILENSDLIEQRDLPVYLSLSSAEQLAVCSSLGSAALYGSIADLTNAAERLAAAGGGNNTGTGGGGGGGRGSGSNSGGIFMSIIQKNENAAGSTAGNTEPTLPFDDLAGVSWAQEAICTLAERGIIVGDGNRMFYPNSNVTREEVVKMLVLALGVYNENAGAGFVDVPATDWSYSYVASAVERGIINGISESEFGRGRVITREEMATMLYRAIKTLGIELTEGVDEGFADSDQISAWAQEACSYMQKTGIMNGIGNGLFAPHDCVTRAQAAKALYELIQK